MRLDMVGRKFFRSVPASESMYMYVHSNIIIIICRLPGSPPVEAIRCHNTTTLCNYLEMKFSFDSMPDAQEIHYIYFLNTFIIVGLSGKFN